MSVNLLSLESSALNGDFSRQASRFLGESEGKVSSAITALVPAVLGGLVKMGSTRGGAEQILSTLRDGDIDASLSGNTARMFNSLESSSWMQNGHRLLSNLFGDKLDGLAGAVASISGMSSKAASSLMDMASPVMFSVLKKQANDQHLDGPGLMNMLSGQTSYLQSALDSRLVKALGFGSVAAFLGGMAGKMVSGASAATGMAANMMGASGAAAGRAVTSPLRKILPWLAGIAALLLGLSMLRTCAMERSITPTMTVPPVASGVGSSAAPESGAAPAMEAATTPATRLPASTDMAAMSAAPAASPAAPAALAMMSPEQVFFATGSAVISEAGQRGIESAVATQRRTGSTLQVTGYTDQRGSLSANEALSKRRAGAVQAALIEAGVPADKIAMKAPMQVEDNTGASSMANEQARRVDITPVR